MIHPSLFEGWCLPAAEGLARGLNLVYCSGSGIDEVSRHFQGQAYPMARQSSIDYWIDAVDKSLLEGPKNPVPESTKISDWQQVSLETLKIYQNLL
jgi:hypothetical protein